MYAGYVLAVAIAIAKDWPLTVPELLTTEFALTNETYLDTFKPISILFFAIGAYAAFQTARKASA